MKDCIFSETQWGYAASVVDWAECRAQCEHLVGRNGLRKMRRSGAVVTSPSKRKLIGKRQAGNGGSRFALPETIDIDN